MSTVPASKREGPRPRMNGLQRRKQLIRVAQRVFAEENYDKATTARIAATAGVTEATLYLHFKSKKDLFIAVLEDCRRFITKSTLRVFESTNNPMERYRRVFDQQHHYTARVNPDVAKVWIMAAVAKDPEIRAAVRRYDQEMFRLATEMIDEAMKEGRIRSDVRPEALARIMMSLVVERVLLVMIGGDEGQETIFSEARDFLERVLRLKTPRGIPAKGPRTRTRMKGPQPGVYRDEA